MRVRHFYFVINLHYYVKYMAQINKYFFSGDTDISEVPRNVLQLYYNI